MNANILLPVSLLVAIVTTGTPGHAIADSGLTEMQRNPSVAPAQRLEVLVFPGVRFSRDTRLNLDFSGKGQQQQYLFEEELKSYTKRNPLQSTDGLRSPPTPVGNLLQITF